jgi:hypothetical protein
MALLVSRSGCGVEGCPADARGTLGEHPGARAGPRRGFRTDPALRSPGSPPTASVGQESEPDPSLVCPDWTPNPQARRRDANPRLPMCAIDYHHFGNRFKQTYACFDCRKVFKAGDEFVPTKVLTPRGMRLNRVPRQVVCPDCGEVMARMGRLFRAPKRFKIRAWAALAEKYGGRNRHLRAPFNEPWRREGGARGKHRAAQIVAARRANPGPARTDDGADRPRD